MVSKFIKRKINKENVWEHGNIAQFWMERREQGPPLGDPQYANIGNVVPYFLAFFFPWNYIWYAFQFLLYIYVFYLLPVQSTFSEVLSRTDLQLLLLLVPQQVLVLIFFGRWTSSFHQIVLMCGKVHILLIYSILNISIYLSSISMYIFNCFCCLL